MKKMELLGLSVVAAALIMTTGCSSDDDSTPAASGPSAPSEVTAPMDINLTSVKNAMDVARSMANNKILPPPLRAVETGAGSESGSLTFDCELSGTYTESYSYTFSGADTYHSSGAEVSWTWTEVDRTSYNNCVETYNTSRWPLYLDTNHRTRNGYYSETTTNALNIDTNTSYQSHVWDDNYTDIRDNNETNASVSYTYSMYRTRDSVWQDDVYRDDVASGSTYTMGETRNGYEERVDTNLANEIEYGNKTEKGNYSELNEGTLDKFAKVTINGFSASYDINASGEFELDGAKTFTNFIVTTTNDGTNDGNITIDGTIGNSCLGGSVTFATNPVVQSNDVDYFSDETDPTTNVLPYAGVITVGTAVVAFDTNDTNHTSATISGAAENNETVYNWTDLAVSNCVN